MPESPLETRKRAWGLTWALEVEGELGCPGNQLRLTLGSSLPTA